MKISVIIPVYGVEKYIRQCLESVINQTYRDLEIIIVNDGTKDNSMKIVEEYLSDKRIKVINQENSGVSIARNRGIENASGEYIAIIDSDDWIELDTFKRLSCLIESREDIIVFDFYKFDENTQRIKNKTTTIEEFKKDISKEKEYLISMYNSESCNKLYRRKFLEEFNIKYKNILYEDVFWKIETFFQAKEIKITGEKYYYYRSGRINSTMWKTAQLEKDEEFIRKQREAYKKIMELLDKFLEENKDRFDDGKKILIEIEKKIWEEKYYHQIQIGDLCREIKGYFSKKEVFNGEKKIIARSLKKVLIEKKLEKIEGLDLFDIFFWKNKIVDFKFIKRRILRKK